LNSAKYFDFQSSSNMMNLKTIIHTLKSSTISFWLDNKPKSSTENVALFVHESVTLNSIYKRIVYYVSCWTDMTFEDSLSSSIIISLAEVAENTQKYNFRNKLTFTFHSFFWVVFFYAAPTEYRTYDDFLAFLVEEDLSCPSVFYLHFP
jgi:hypothetical protein